MFRHAAHMWMCGLMVLGAVVVLATSGSAVAFIPAIACVLMMFAMMSVMGGHHRASGQDRS